MKNRFRATSSALLSAALLLFLATGVSRPLLAQAAASAQDTGQSASASLATSQGPGPLTPAIEQKVDAMIHKLTLQQKITLIAGIDHMFTHAEPSIGLPRLKMSDGPVGVRVWGPSTAYAAGIGLAASWDTTLADNVGVALGRDSRARGVHFLLGPAVDIYRLPVNGRNFEYFGEDPYLAGQIAAHYILGVQSQGVVATVKHFAANNSEYDRLRTNAIVGERALREMYLPAFEAAVKEGHVGAVMDSYNLLNGEHSTQNKFLNIEVLRKDWGFNGIVMSDWGGTHSTVAAANAGLDLEMPSDEYFNEKDLMPAIQSGKVSEATIDTKVRHILQTALRFNFLNRPQLELNIPKYDQQNQAVALQSAEESAVLLKNEGNLLPLDRNAVHTLAVIGPNAYPAEASGGGSAHVTAIDPVSFMTGLSDALYPKTKVTWNSGVVSPEEVFKNTHWCVDKACKEQGLLRGEYVLSAGGERLVSGVDKTIDHIHGSWMLEQTKSKRRMEWHGYFVPKTSGDYIVVLGASDQGQMSDLSLQFDLKLNGKPVIEGDTQKGGLLQSKTVTLQAGQPVLVSFNYFLGVDDTGGPSLGIIAASKVVDPEAIQLAKAANDVVLAVGFNHDLESESFDRTYTLPFGQVQLIQAITAANPHTIVVLTAGGSVATEKWLDRVPVLLQTWYGGSQAGNALTKILFGDVNPSGKLPISWAKRIQDNPAYNYYYEHPGSRDVKYDDGIFQGYRYYETSAVKPLFPFGFGLSYTTFSFSNLSVSPESASPNGPITVGFDVKNTGQRAGAEVAQIYVGDPSATVKRPRMELKGFSRVLLQPGQTRHVTVSLDKRSLAYWDVNTHGWKVDPGKFIAYVGDSAESVPLQKSFTVQ